MVLGPKSKIIKGLRLPTLLGLGASIGEGTQSFPYIHQYDLVNAFLYSLNDPSFSGVFNLVAPESISNIAFTKTFGKVLQRPVFLNIPPVLVRLVLGEAASLLLESPVVVPKNLLDSGFEFKFPSIEETLRDIMA